MNYLQSGPEDSIKGPEPYDFGWLQGLDALRAVWLVFHELVASKQPFGRGRLFATGGSGGGNVTLMANKLATRTFACVVDMCGMKKLSDALAYNLPAANGLSMLVHQAALSFSLWFGRNAPLEVMRDAAERALAGRESPP